ncbi:isoaspartyl peptidase/L-asparaginase family protein [Thorsellia anophelis]|uniref:Isoaspartyl peptidase n=1 Tax=Thorsellia anophelis DSM 18579 TaxID=1123402 RepID=A0A1H9ZDH5_9GAMM|nr:isoaspartyl peptidase/L-asparaginase [Thorsellia anophelis]SES79563.1 beta-aspartyl-peptidase (threonine type) [Thorsellia anophelis DSM 18579]
MKKIRPVVVIHGGAGVISQSTLTQEQAERYTQALTEILLKAQQLLKSGATAIDVVTEAVIGLENCPLFNAGYGAVFTHEGTHELDAAIMDGASLQAGAITGVAQIKNPIIAAKKVLQESEHVLLSGQGAEAFARKHHIEMVDKDYFSTEFRRNQLHEALKNNQGVVLDHSGKSSVPLPELTPLDEKHKFGTVGAVAIDSEGNLAAATSTGGMTNKQVGRIGDSPIIGAGTYANNESVAISCTGTGEVFMRAVAAFDVHALMTYKDYTLTQATEEVVISKLKSMGGEGGLIAVDKWGNISLCFNSEGMYRGYAYDEGDPTALIFGE